MAQLSDSLGGTFHDLSHRLKLRITGRDAFRFLNGQITNDLHKATPNNAIQAAILNAKGKLNAVVFISTEGESFLLDSDPEIAEELPARLDRYIVADDVQIEDVSDQFVIFHVRSLTDPPSFSPAGRNLRVMRFGTQGWDLWCEKSERDRVFDHLTVHFTFCNNDCTETTRIERGIPRWGRELTDQIIPIEANLESTSIDYGKGCYIGQEVISRMKMSGQTNKRLCGLISLSGAPLQANMRLTADVDESKEAGWITSATRSPRLNKEIALGYLKRGFDAQSSRIRACGSEVMSGTREVPVEVAALPFF